MEIVVTDFGNVRISARSLAWLNSIDHDWREIASNKRKRGKHAQYVREQVRRFESAVMVAAEIGWYTGDGLQEF